ncbi:MAG: thiolase family protein [Proteobacteria bacterium]|nr:thiolase family protein [Pseudomonadota bacterium]MBU1584800.1 thiolase family protein [Pseudomonadota bacterium]MBU2453405.1 thiolase family protein [Pseudomonadota bacterium]MBU2629523.1 thiolase family protein [Pseudomonadota bacterium]
MLSKAFIPYKGYYSTPFVKWQGSLANENSITLGAQTSKRWLATRKFDPQMFDYLMLGVTIGQPALFYGSPWAAALIGATGTAGLLISQACSTATTGIFQAAQGIETRAYSCVYTLFTDRCSNGPHTVWPNPKGPGGQVISENWVMDHFGNDPWAGSAMIQTAENVIQLTGITRKECDANALRRYEQYLDALANDRAFQKRYMFPVEIKVSKKKNLLIDADEGVMETTEEGLKSLRPVLPGGRLTFGSQTHPADGHCALIVTGKEKAGELSDDPGIQIQVISFGHARVKKAHMPMAPVPAAVMALEKAGLAIKDIKVIKTHNPFAANDIYMSREMKLNINTFNNFGSSLIFGHPQAPTAGRSIIEGIEEAAMLGGGYVLFTGCAAGDTSAALILKVG